MGANPSFAATPRVEIGQISAANPNRDGTGTIVSVMSGVAAGSRIDEVNIQAIGVTTAGTVRMYISHDGGVTWRLRDEFSVIAVAAPSASVSPFSTSRPYNTLLLRDANSRLGFSTANAETFNVFCTGGDF